MVDQTQLNLKALSGGDFQQLMFKLLPRIESKYEGLINSGAVEGTSKTRKGTPDIWLKRDENTLICFEITVDHKKNKLTNDLEKCINLYEEENKKEYICVLNYEPQYTWIKPLEEICSENNIIFTLIHNSKIAIELDKKSNHDLREIFLNIQRENILTSEIILNTGEYYVQIDFSKEIQEARELLKKFEIRSARERTFSIKAKIEAGNSKEEKEELYRIIADSYLMDPVEQLKAIEWIEKLILVTENEKIKDRRKALLLILQKRTDEAEEILDNLIKNENYEENVIELKCNILLSKKDYKDGIFFLESLSVPSKQKNHWLAIFNLSENKFENALKHAIESLKDDNSFRNRKLLFDVEISYLDNKFSQISINENDFKDANEILSESDDLLKIIGNNIPAEKADILSKKAIILNWLSRYDDGLSAMNQAYNIYPKLPTLLRNRAILLHNKNIAEAIENLNLYLEIIPEDTIAKRLKIKFLMKHNPEAAISEIKEEINTFPALDNKLLLVECYLHNFQTTDAEILLKSIKKEYKNNPKISIVEAKIKLKLNKNDIDDAIIILEATIEKMDIMNRQEAVLLLTDLYIEKGEEYFYKKAVEVLNPYLNKFILSPYLSKYLLCLYNLHAYEKCLAYSKEIRELHGDYVEFIRYEAYINILYENFFEAISLFKYLIKESKENKIQYQLNLSYCYFRLGDKQRAYDIIEQSISDTLMPNELVLVSKIYSSYGLKEKAVIFAYKAYKLNKEDRSLNENFIECMLLGKELDSIIYAEIIKEYQNCLNNYESKFPNSRYLRKLNLPKEPEELRKFIFKMLNESKTHFKKAEEIYLESKLPISMLSKNIGRDYLSTWFYLTSNKRMSIWGESGNIDELNNEKSIVCNVNECVLDAQIILALYDLDLLHELKSIFNKIYISQSIIDLLNNEINRLEVTQDKQSSFLTLTEDEQVHLIEISKKEITAKLNWFKSLLNILKDKKYNFHIVGKPINPKINPKLSKILNFLDECESEPIKFSISNNKSVAIGNSSIRGILRNKEFRVDSFGIYAIIFNLLNNKVINYKYFYKKIIQLIEINYKYISFDENILLYTLMKNGYCDCEEVRMIFGLIADHYWDIDSVFNVLNKFIISLWCLTLSEEIMKKYTQLAIRMFFNRIDFQKKFDLNIYKKYLKHVVNTSKTKWGNKKKKIYIELIDKIDI